MIDQSRSGQPLRLRLPTPSQSTWLVLPFFRQIPFPSVLVFLWIIQKIIYRSRYPPLLLPEQLDKLVKELSYLTSFAIVVSLQACSHCLSWPKPSEVNQTVTPSKKTNLIFLFLFRFFSSHFFLRASFFSPLLSLRFLLLSSRFLFFLHASTPSALSLSLFLGQSAQEVESCADGMRGGGGDARKGARLKRGTPKKGGCTWKGMRLNRGERVQKGVPLKKGAPEQCGWDVLTLDFHRQPLNNRDSSAFSILSSEVLQTVSCNDHLRVSVSQA